MVLHLGLGLGLGLCLSLSLSYHLRLVLGLGLCHLGVTHETLLDPHRLFHLLLRELNAVQRRIVYPGIRVLSPGCRVC